MEWLYLVDLLKWLIHVRSIHVLIGPGANDLTATLLIIATNPLTSVSMAIASYHLSYHEGVLFAFHE